MTAGAFPLPEPMARALAAARIAAADGEVPVGAALVRDGVVIAVAANAPRTLHDPTAHAEIRAIREAAAALGRERLEDCDLWVTLEPCAMCAGAIAHARIRRLYYGASDAKGGAVEHGPRFFGQSTCHHRPEVYSGIGEEEAAGLLRGFSRRAGRHSSSCRPRAGIHGRTEVEVILVLLASYLSCSRLPPEVDAGTRPA